MTVPMASLRNPNSWAPFVNTKDCSQGFCSLYCPQWCYIIFPPPPPLKFDDEDSGSMFSPLVIAIIGVLASAFLLVSYYVIVTKFCKNKGVRREQPDEEMDVIPQVPALQESWHFTANNGLDEALIKLITVCQYKSGDGMVEGTECSVCLSEFEEGERLRLLPKCSHAFHLPCIDMWLKSHSNCPLCRANIICITMATSESHQLPTEAESSARNHFNSQVLTEGESAAIRENSQGTRDEESRLASENDAALKGSLSPESHLVSRRSISMGYLPFSIADAMRMNEDEEKAHGPSAGEIRKAGCGSNVLRPIGMKRSFSSGIFFTNKHHKGPSLTNIPF